MTFLIAMLTGLGVGSGGLYIFYLTLIKNLPQREAQGINLLFFITATLAATIVNLIKKRVFFPAFFVVFPFGIIGALLGCRFATSIDTKILSIMFGSLIAIVGIVGFIKLLKKR